MGFVAQDSSATSCYSQQRNHPDDLLGAERTTGFCANKTSVNATGRAQLRILLVVNDVLDDRLRGAVCEQGALVSGEANGVRADRLVELLSFIERCVDDGQLDRLACRAGCCLVDRNRRGCVLRAKRRICILHGVLDDKRRGAVREQVSELSSCRAGVSADRLVVLLSVPLGELEAELDGAGREARLHLVCVSGRSCVLRAQGGVSRLDGVRHCQRRGSVAEQVSLVRRRGAGVSADRAVVHLAVPGCVRQVELDGAVLQASLCLIGGCCCVCRLRAKRRICILHGVLDDKRRGAVGEQVSGVSLRRPGVGSDRAVFIRDPLGVLQVELDRAGRQAGFHLVG